MVESPFLLFKPQILMVKIMLNPEFYDMFPLLNLNFGWWTPIFTEEIARKRRPP